MPVPPPPPPPGPPPPPAFPLGSAGKGPDPNSRNQLLSSIRQGAKLKKTTVVNDRSAPIVDGNRNKNSIGGSSNSLSSSAGAGSISSISSGRGNGLTVPQGLGDLFAGGIPKLKPVGSTPAKGSGSGFNRKTETSQGHRNTGRNNNSSSPPSHDNNSYNSSSNNNNNINHNSITVNLMMKSNATSLGNKPAPPPPPPVALRQSQTADSNNDVRERKPSNFGKPSVAPKPPGVNGQRPSKPDPPPKLPNLYIPPASYTDSGSPSVSNTSTPTPPTPPSAGVNRAQSMRMPKPVSSATTSASSIEYRTMGRAGGRDFAASNQPPPPPRVMNGGASKISRPSPLRPPAAKPPPPPNKAPPSHPPPPPPSGAPPPPPHRTAPAPTPPHVRVNGNLGPLPPTPISNGTPPPPPTRNSSMRSITSTNSVASVASSSGSSSSSVVHNGPDLEARFAHLFVSIEDLPSPNEFRGILKTYPSKNAQSIKRQPAPQPPTNHIQLDQKLWINNSSTC